MDDFDDDELISLINIHDIIDYVIDNIDNEYLKNLLLDYYENDNNIMHILFMNGRTADINKLICNKSLTLLVEKNNDNLCPIDFINKNTLKVVLKECLSSSIDSNNEINYLHNKLNYIEKHCDKITLMFGCTSIVYLFCTLLSYSYSKV